MHNSMLHITTAKKEVGWNAVSMNSKRNHFIIKYLSDSLFLIFFKQKVETKICKNENEDGVN